MAHRHVRVGTGKGRGPGAVVLFGELLVVLAESGEPFEEVVGMGGVVVAAAEGETQVGGAISFVLGIAKRELTDPFAESELFLVAGAPGEALECRDDVDAVAGIDGNEGALALGDRAVLANDGVDELGIGSRERRRRQTPVMRRKRNAKRRRGPQRPKGGV